MEYIKANRNGSRMAEIENSCGWNSVTKIHKSKKQYKRVKKVKI